jgi:hypothetical protein
LRPFCGGVFRRCRCACARETPYTIEKDRTALDWDNTTGLIPGAAESGGRIGMEALRNANYAGRFELRVGAIPPVVAKNEHFASH